MVTPQSQNVHKLPQKPRRSQGQTFTKANMLITSPVGILLNLVDGDLTFCPYF